MLSLALLFPLAVVDAQAQSFSADLDGDGKAETVALKEDAWYVNTTRVIEGGDMVEVSLLDISSSDKTRELSVCEVGPRDDKSCYAHAWSGGKLVKIPVTNDVSFQSLTTTGNGIVLGSSWDLIAFRTDKLVLKSGRLELVPQPFHWMGVEVHIDATAPIYLQPTEGSTVVANLKPDSEITVVVGHTTQRDWYLVKTSTGLTGWISLQGLAAASEDIRMRTMAG